VRYRECVPRISGLPHRGTLKVAAPADIAVLELREGTFEFVDNFGEQTERPPETFPSATVLAGKPIPRGITSSAGLSSTGLAQV
jgi:predicted amidohydrolase